MTEKRQANKKIKKDTARQIALEVICAVIDGGAYANIALNKTLRTKKNGRQGPQVHYGAGLWYHKSKRYFGLAFVAVIGKASGKN